MTENHPSPILRIEDIERSYGSIDVLEGVSLRIDPGRVTAIIGPNGSGKTTLVRTVVGLDDPDAGTVSYEGPATARPIGYLQQRPAFRSGVTVADTLAFYADLVGESTDDALARLERVGLADAADRDVDALSGGMTRLVGVAQATIGSPPIVVLDEPASGLDPGMSVRIFEVAAELAADGTAVVLTSHDLSLVERTADHVVLLDDGGIAVRGSPATIRDELGVASLLGVFENSTTGETGTVRVRGESA